jgi:muramoyltetrapeptide carboxypeptidase
MPPKPQKGSALGIIAPAGSGAKVSKARWQRALSWFESHGLSVVTGDCVFSKYFHTTSNAEARATEIMEMFERPEVSVIIAAMGGSTSQQILPFLDFQLIANNPKVFVGFSDITSLTSAIHRCCNMVTFYGPVFATFSQPDLPEFTTKNFHMLIFNGSSHHLIGASSKWADDQWYLEKEDRPRRWNINRGWRIIKGGCAVGPAHAAHLGTLLLLVGTEYMPNLDGVILFVEGDESEDTATVERYFTQLSQIGTIGKLKGLVVGRYPRSVGFNKSDTLERIILDSTCGLDIPIISEVDIGHTDPLFTVPNGIASKIDTEQRTIEFLTPAVKW